ncbi:MAG: hypothetical protein KDK05_19460, partial [Candidatus Competibacteraceae bacterium]|nr:hypothetical protein [Candidatus Competibacteraceae bacterium]
RAVNTPCCLFGDVYWQESSRLIASQILLAVACIETMSRLCNKNLNPAKEYFANRPRTDFAGYRSAG